MQLTRYSNRKVYNNNTGSYVNHEEIIYELVRGAPIQVIEHGTNIDVTRKTLTQVLLTQLKKEMEEKSAEDLKTLVIKSKVGPTL